MLSNVENAKINTVCHQKGCPSSFTSLELIKENVNEKYTTKYLFYTQISGDQVTPECLCCVGVDICIFDNSCTRLVAASSAGWGSVLVIQNVLGQYLFFNLVFRIIHITHLYRVNNMLP